MEQSRNIKKGEHWMMTNGSLVIVINDKIENGSCRVNAVSPTGKHTVNTLTLLSNFTKKVSLQEALLFVKKFSSKK